MAGIALTELNNHKTRQLDKNLNLAGIHVLVHKTEEEAEPMKIESYSQ